MPLRNDLSDGILVHLQGPDLLKDSCLVLDRHYESGFLVCDLTPECDEINIFRFPTLKEALLDFANRIKE
jgi:hypothetical protein